ncbi:MAG: indole-3-glycerol phosphate synthase TrpC [Planctomycetaceae bacterium]|nr:indole-3-glycerol phosphate synthase TrpC [Planctomycetaceae bacterium]
MTDILRKITDARLQDVQSFAMPKRELLARLADRHDCRPFCPALRQNMTEPGKAAVIAEIKRGSPAKGLFCPELDTATFARDYETGGAACLSVLTEPCYFFGARDDLITARQNCTLPVLQKDFIVTEYQILEAALDADAVLLIARCLEQTQLADYHALATEHHLDVLVEVFDEEDIDKIEPFHFPLIGINHRNLATMQIDLARSKELFARFSPDQTVVAASGIKCRTDMEQLMPLGIRAFLIGESLSTSPNRVELLRELVGG